jgi:hypothetical protein
MKPLRAIQLINCIEHEALQEIGIKISAWSVSVTPNGLESRMYQMYFIRFTIKAEF